MTAAPGGPAALVDSPPALLVARAIDGEQSAWNALVARYSPLVWAVCRRCRLSEADAADVAQTVWLRLVERLAELRDANALPGWIVTTTRRECLLTIRNRSRHGGGYLPPEFENLADGAPAVDTALLAAERRAVLRDALSQLPARCRQLLQMLVEDPPPPYADVATRMRVPVGSIGPTRSRCLDRLRRTPAMARFLEDRAEVVLAGERHG